MNIYHKILCTTEFAPCVHSHSFPTRRSSYLGRADAPGGDGRRPARHRYGHGPRGGNGLGAGTDRRLHRRGGPSPRPGSATHLHRSEEHTSELQSRFELVCRHMIEKNTLTYMT